MLVTLNSIVVEKAPKGYSIANISFTRDGKVEMRKIMSFGGSAKAFNQLVELKDFPKDVNVVMEKNAKGFWEWKSIETPTIGVSNGSSNTGATSGQRPGKVIGSNYETPEERARRQVYIIRQSSISSAIEYFKAQSPKGFEGGISDVLEVAKDFENYVMDTNVSFPSNEVVE